MRLLLSLGAVIAAFVVDTASAQSEAPSTASVYHVGDAIELLVVGYEDDLNGVYRVASDGALSIPYIGRVPAVGLTHDQLTETLEGRVWSYYINRPEVVVRPLYAVTVLGNVRRPGTFNIGGGERLSALIALAGGTDDEAYIEKAKVTRDGKTLERNLKSALSSGETIQDIGIQSGDVVFVPRTSWWRSFRNWAVVVSTVSLSFAVYDRITN